VSRAAGAIASVAIVLALSACWNQGHHPDATATAVDIAGTWVQVDGPGSITFSTDGTFVAEAYPQEILCGDPSSGSGDWEFDEDPAGYEGGQAQHWIVYSFDEDGGKTGCATQLFLQRIDGELQLFCWIGDPDMAEDITFVRPDEVSPS
jgi:hypothetical protein